MRIISALVCRSTLLFPLPQFLCTRHHSTIKLFVAGLSYDANELILIDAFRQHSEIIEGEGNVCFTSRHGLLASLYSQL